MLTFGRGYLLVYPKREDVVFTPGSEEKLKSYFFGKKRKPHRFCPECSSSVLIDFHNSDFEKQRAYLAVNVRPLSLASVRVLRTRGTCALPSTSATHGG